MKNLLLVFAVALLASCSKTENERKCYTCYYENSLDFIDFCGTEDELKQYIEFRSTKKPKIKTCQ